MRTFDINPLFRHTVGFDRMVRLLDGITADQTSSFPPYNIEKIDENTYRISLAVAGFTEADLNVQIEDNHLTVSGVIGKRREEAVDKQYLHHGIAERAFEHRFNLADHIEVSDANLVNGLLHIVLVREVPEAMKPRTIAINNLKAFDDKAA